MQRLPDSILKSDRIYKEKAVLYPFIYLVLMTDYISLDILPSMLN